jgi:NAD(P)-dependent dehydrogenase (short-subunit alcohol dehydrogenase family)
MAVLALSAAVVIGASGGIGAALHEALADEGAYARVHALSRSGAAPIDITDEASIAAAAARIADGPAPSLVILATGLLHDAEHGPEKSYREFDPAWLEQVLRWSPSICCR